MSSLSELYVKAYVGCFGFYGLQMLAVPKKMVEDHFEEKASRMTTFWIRGQSVSLLGLCFTVTQLPTPLAVKVGAVTSLAIGLLYPWNAKFSLISDLPVKYPMHYVPEVLMLAMTGAGAFCVFFGNK